MPSPEIFSPVSTHYSNYTHMFDICSAQESCLIPFRYQRFQHFSYVPQPTEQLHHAKVDVTANARPCVSSCVGTAETLGRRLKDRLWLMLSLQLQSSQSSGRTYMWGPVSALVMKEQTGSPERGKLSTAPGRAQQGTACLLRKLEGKPPSLEGLDPGCTAAFDI